MPATIAFDKKELDLTALLAMDTTEATLEEGPIPGQATKLDRRYTCSLEVLESKRKMCSTLFSDVKSQLKVLKDKFEANDDPNAVHGKLHHHFLDKLLESTGEFNDERKNTLAILAKTRALMDSHDEDVDDRTMKKCMDRMNKVD